MSNSDRQRSPRNPAHNRGAGSTAQKWAAEGACSEQNGEMESANRGWVGCFQRKPRALGQRFSHPGLPAQGAWLIFRSSSSAWRERETECGPGTDRKRKGNLKGRVYHKNNLLPFLIMHRPFVEFAHVVEVQVLFAFPHLPLFSTGRP